MKIDYQYKKNKISLSKKISKGMKFKVTNNDDMFILSIFNKPKLVAGITSMCGDGKHILFLDYDDTCKWVVEKDIERLIENNPYITPFYIFTTKEEKIDGELIGNYHVICLQKFTPHEIVNLQLMTHCDSAYSTMPLRKPFRAWVLRIGKKCKRDRPKFLDIIMSKNYNEHTVNNEISSAHLDLLSKLYRLPKIEYLNQDNLKVIYKTIYETLNRVR